MAYEFYVTVEGTKQGLFKGESARDAHKGKLAGLAFSYEVKSPRDAATGQSSGKRQHGEVWFTKRWGAASPQLFSALVTNEVLKSALFEFARTDDQGEEHVFHTIKLTNAKISSIRQYIEIEAAGPSEQHELEAVALTFQTIEIENRDGKTTAVDSWSSPK